MITRLFIGNFWTHQNQTFLFDQGLTGIIGPNESGKSLIQEAIRYALFGTAALRDGAPKDLHIELDFEVSGVKYSVVRKGRHAQLGDRAVGTRPVNEAIIAILGYDLQVFDVANSCNQGAVEALSNMRPAERKAMVDRTVGLDTLDVVLKYLGERGNALKSEAMGMRAALVEPLQPEVPENYRPVEVIEPLAAEALKGSRELAQLTGFLSKPEAMPTEARGLFKVDDIHTQRDAAYADMREFHQLTGLLAKTPTPPVPPEISSVTDSVEDLEVHQDLFNIYVADVKRLTSGRDALDLEQFTAAELDARVAQHDEYDLWVERTRLLAQGHLCCPACNHSWPVAGNIPEVEETDKPTLSRPGVEKERAKLGNRARWYELDEQLAQMTEVKNRAADLQTARKYVTQMEAFERAQGAYQLFNAELPAKIARHASLAGAEATLGKLNQELSNTQQWTRYDNYELDAAPARARVGELTGIDDVYAGLQSERAFAKQYESLLDQHTRLMKNYVDQQAVLLGVTQRSDMYLKARMDVHDLKVRVKSYLLPSLNKVASHFLNQMTGGARVEVKIDDDFDIQIDGAGINTLSGSAKAVANLAIRIALGQILTNRVFSIFMGDEIDGSMDDERAEHTAQALQRLTKLVKQVILITHKRPETDHTIELRKPC